MSGIKGNNIHLNKTHSINGLFEIQAHLQLKHWSNESTYSKVWLYEHLLLQTGQT